MHKFTLRLPGDLYEALKRLAAEYDLTLADLIRIVLAGKLNTWLGSIKIIDNDSANDIKKIVLQFTNIISDIKIELQRIGNNYNQIARRINANTIANNGSNSIKHESYFETKMQIKKGDSKAEQIPIDNDIERLIERYITATKDLQETIDEIYKAAI